MEKSLKVEMAPPQVAYNERAKEIIITLDFFKLGRVSGKIFLNEVDGLKPFRIHMGGEDFGILDILDTQALSKVIGDIFMKFITDKAPMKIIYRNDDIVVGELEGLPNRAERREKGKSRG